MIEKGVYEFQSLFYWKYHFNLDEYNENSWKKGVSILVLLEVPLQHLNLST